MTMNRLFFVILLMALVSNCEKKNLKQEEAEVDKNNQKNSVALTNDIEKGRTVYFANCVSCHNRNPKKPGSIGPELYGVPIYVLTQKIISGTYPENYRPKKHSKIMPLMPHLNNKITNLHAFINSSSTLHLPTFVFFGFKIFHLFVPFFNVSSLSFTVLND